MDEASHCYFIPGQSLDPRFSKTSADAATPSAHYTKRVICQWHRLGAPLFRCLSGDITIHVYTHKRINITPLEKGMLTTRLASSGIRAQTKHRI